MDTQTLWVEYDGVTNTLRVYTAHGVVVNRPAGAVITVSMDLPGLVGAQAWFGFSAGTGGSYNAHDIESWSLSTDGF